MLWNYIEILILNNIFGIWLENIYMYLERVYEWLVLIIYGYMI